VLQLQRWDGDAFEVRVAKAARDSLEREGHDSNEREPCDVLTNGLPKKLELDSENGRWVQNKAGSFMINGRCC
jgi:hypothetical protein